MKAGLGIVRIGFLTTAAILMLSVGLRAQQESRLVHEPDSSPALMRETLGNTSDAELVARLNVARHRLGLVENQYKKGVLSAVRSRRRHRRGRDPGGPHQ